MAKKVFQMFNYYHCVFDMIFLHNESHLLNFTFFLRQKEKSEEKERNVIKRWGNFNKKKTTFFLQYRFFFFFFLLTQPKKKKKRRKNIFKNVHIDEFLC